MATRADVVAGHIDLLAGQLSSLLTRVDALESAARELRTEAAAAAHALALQKKPLEDDLIRQRIRRSYNATSILRAARDRRLA